MRSAEHLSQATPSAEEQGHLQYQFNYLTELIRRLRQALGITEATDQQAADSTKTIKGSLE
jgi:hypothetical protein